MIDSNSTCWQSFRPEFHSLQILLVRPFSRLREAWLCVHWCFSSIFIYILRCLVLQFNIELSIRDVSSLSSQWYQRILLLTPLCWWLLYFAGISRVLGRLGWWWRRSANKSLESKGVYALIHPFVSVVWILPFTQSLIRKVHRRSASLLCFVRPTCARWPSLCQGIWSCCAPVLRLGVLSICQDWLKVFQFIMLAWFGDKLVQQHSRIYAWIYGMSSRLLGAPASFAVLWIKTLLSLAKEKSSLWLSLASIRINFT